uniref:Integrase n=1 Tax=Mesocestoides corti TaxID=53468 RepID=A0A5K3FQR3_MESCO
MHTNRLSCSEVTRVSRPHMDKVANNPSLTDVVGQDLYATLPKYTEHPSLWFRRLDVYFHRNKITSQTTKYYRVLAEIPMRVGLAVLDLIEDIPEHNPYDELKHAIITRMNQIYETRARRLLPNV